MVVEGAAGIGKTSLLAAAAERAAARGTRVLAARAAPLEQAYGFGVVRQLFEPVRAGCDAAEWQRLTADAAGLALRALDPAAAVAAPGDDVTHATLHGLFWLAANLAAQGPLVLAVDDAHWADPPSLRWLGYLARRLEGLPVLALVAVRSGEPPSEPRLLDDLLAEPRALLLRPRPLGPDSSAAVVRGRIGDAAPEFCAACHDATGGNPFLLDALIASVRAEGARRGCAGGGRDRALRPRGGGARAGPPARAAPGARELARALAVLGDDAAPREVAALAGLDAAEAAKLSDALRAAGVLRPGPARPRRAARVRPPDPARRRHRRPGAGGAGAVARAGGAAALGRRRRIRSASPCSCWRPSRRAIRTRCARCAPPRGPRPRAGRPRAPRRTCAARWPSRPGPASARRSCSSSASRSPPTATPTRPRCCTRRSSSIADPAARGAAACARRGRWGSPRSTPTSSRSAAGRWPTPPTSRPTTSRGWRPS